MSERPGRPKMIVGEAAVNWVNGETGSGYLLSQRFESVIAHNLARGYRLHSWEMSRVVTNLDGVMAINETIVAVFEDAT